MQFSAEWFKTLLVQYKLGMTVQRLYQLICIVLLLSFSVQAFALRKEEYPKLLKATPQLGNVSIGLTLHVGPDGYVISLKGIPRLVAQYLEEYQYESVIVDFGPDQTAGKDGPPREIVFHFAPPEPSRSGNQFEYWAESSNDLKNWGVEGLTEFSWLRGGGECGCEAAGIEYDARPIRYVRFTWEQGYPPPFIEISNQMKQ